MNRERIIKRVFIGIIIIFVGVFLIQEYQKNKQEENPISNVEIKIKAVNEVLLSMVPVETLNPLISNDEDVFYINKLIYSSLFTFDENMTPQGDLVEKYTFKGNSVVLVLKNAKWHDGKGVSGEDISFTVKAIKAIGATGPYFEKVDKIKSVSGEGNSITIEFKDEKDMSLSYLAFPVVPEHKYKDVKEYAADIENFSPVGSGTYKVESYDKTKVLKLAVNENFYGAKAKSSVKIEIIKPDANRINMVQSSNLTATLEKSSTRETKINKKGMEIENFIGNKVDFVGFNFESQFMENKKLRRVVAYAIDIEKIIEEDYYNSAVASDSVYIPNYLGAESIEAEYSYDLDAALKLLKDDGFKDTNDDGILENKNGKKLSLKLIVNSNKIERVEVADRLEKELEKLGIEVKVEKLDPQAYLAYLRNGNFDIYIGGMTVDESMDFRSILYTGGSDNYIGYSDKDVDEYLDNMLNGQTIEKMNENLVSFKKYLSKELPYYCIGYSTYGIVKAPAFAGTLDPTYNNPYRGIETWFSEYEERIVEEETEEPPKEK